MHGIGLRHYGRPASNLSPRYCPPCHGEQELAVLVNRVVDDLIIREDGIGFFCISVRFIGDRFPVASYYKWFYRPGAFSIANFSESASLSFSSSKKYFGSPDRSLGSSFGSAA